MTPLLPSDRAQRTLRGVVLFGLLALLHSHPSRAAAIDLTATADLGFGRMVATNGSGTVTISPSGNRSTLGSVVLGNGFGASPAEFKATGDPNASYSITLPSVVQLTSGLDSMSVDGFTSSPSGSGNLGPSGSETIHLGATLHVNATQQPAAYSGTFVVIVSYD